MILLSQTAQQAVPNFYPACKVGWQANRRFWEEDQRDEQGNIIYGRRIYGGISYTEHPITQMWYPSEGYFSKKGTLTDYRSWSIFIHRPTSGSHGTPSGVDKNTAGVPAFAISKTGSVSRKRWSAMAGNVGR